MMPATTTLAPTDKITRRVWSFSAAETYGRCPKAWDFQYGSGAVRMTDTVTPSSRKVGRVLHYAVGAAYQAAAAETHNYSDQSMLRYREVAERAFASAWTNHGMPDGGQGAELAHRLTGVLLGLLRSQRVPPPFSIAEAETRHIVTTSTGLPYVFIPDVVFRVANQGLLVRDWKYGRVDQRTPAESYQAGLYVAGLAAAYPGTQVFTAEFYSMSRLEVVSGRVTADRAARALDWLERTAAAAEADTAPAPRPTERCDACPFKPVCPAYVGRV
jgi:hypothetical protein